MGLVQPGEDTASGGPKSSPQHLQRVTKKKELGFLQECREGGTKDNTQMGKSRGSC